MSGNSPSDEGGEAQRAAQALGIPSPSPSTSPAPQKPPEREKFEDRLKANIVWFALGMMVTGIVGGIGAVTWLDGHIEERIKTSEYLKTHNGLKGDKGDAGPPGQAGLKGDRGDPGIAPARAVIAFDLPGCPNGWMPFTPAISRMIVGAVDSHSTVVGNMDASGRPLTARVYRSDGGEEKHILTILEMPSHNHPTNGQAPAVGVPWQNRSGDSGSYSTWDQNFHPYIGSHIDLPSQGGDQPHNIMPPFVSLFYCTPNEASK